MNHPEVQIKKLDSRAPDHIFRELATIHREQISEGFLTRLGPKFLYRMYRTIATSEHSFAIVAVSDKAVAGFICGSTNSQCVYSSFLRNNAILVLPGLVPTLFRPTSIFRIWETWRYPAQAVQQSLPSSEILNFCVAADCQRRGVGRRLFGALEAEFAHRNVAAIKIVTGAHQRSAQAFYESIGAQLVERVEVHRGSESLVYVQAIPTINIGPHLPLYSAA